MFKKIRRALGVASRPAAGPVMQTRYHWRCACGARSRGGSLNEGDVKYNADRHLWGKYKDKEHPTPEIYTTEEPRPY